MPHPNLPPFEGPLTKAQWAHKTIERLGDLIDDFKANSKAEMKPDPYSKDDLEYDHYRMAFEPPMPEEIPYLLGDAIHNLRASLDIMICDIAAMQGKSRNFKFPFAADEDALKKIVDKETRRLGDNVASKILALAPHSGENGNVELRALHDLDILDKHKIIIPHFGAASIDSPEFGDDHFSITIGLPCKFFETQLQSIKKGTKGRKLMKFDRIEDPYFPDIVGPFSGQPIVPVLTGLFYMVEEIIDDFASLYGLKRAPEKQ